MHSPLLRRLTRGASLCFFLLACGCMNPRMYYGNPYSQPMYAPPQMLNQSVPGQLVIPESTDGIYEPGNSTYDVDPDDDFDRSTDPGDSRFFTPDPGDGAPLPRDLNRSDDLFESDIGGPTTSLDPRTTQRGGTIQQVSHIEAPVEYGFDRSDYNWLRGTLHYIESRDIWVIEYSLAANDRYRGSMVLDATSRQLHGLRDGDAIDVHGVVRLSKDRNGNAHYHVERIRRLTPQTAM